MHGSLLPKYRGRACVNWAVLNGEKETGVTLHRMTKYADRGNIIAQEAVEIGENETSHEVFKKIIPAAGRVLSESLDDILVEDEVSIKVTIIRNNLPEGQQVGLTHSLGYTELFEEKVALTLITNKFIMDFSVETINNRVTEHIFSNRFSEPGKVKVVCDMISLDYKGVNISKEFEINVCKSSEKRKEHYKDIEKRQIKKIEPSYFQQILSSVVPIGADDDEEEEEEEDDKKNEEKKNKKDQENEEEKKDKDNEKEEEKKDKDKEKEEDKKDNEKNDEKKEEEKNKEKEEHEKQD